MDSFNRRSLVGWK